MAQGFSSTVANAALNAILRNTSYAGSATLFIQLHTGSPGASGTANVASNNTRKAIAFNAASGGVAVNTSDITWTGVPTTETYTNFSVFDASSAGNFYGDGVLTANGVTSGDTFVISAGAASTTLNIAT